MNLNEFRVNYELFEPIFTYWSYLFIISIQNELTFFFSIFQNVWSIVHIRIEKLKKIPQRLKSLRLQVFKNKI